jgi:hypothetical protein
MDRDLLKVKPQNLPTYVYKLEATIALVHDKIAYKIRNYTFTNITICVNQPLRVGDVLDNTCCYFGNENTEIIPNLQKHKELDGVEGELKDYYGCQITQLTISYIEDYDFPESCGVGKCLVFIELSANNVLGELKKLNQRERLTPEEQKRWTALQKEMRDADKLDYWKNRIPDWDERLECIGEIPSNLIY